MKYIATVYHTDHEGFVVDRTERLGVYETYTEAETAMKQAGLTSYEMGWLGNECYGYIEMEKSK